MDNIAFTRAKILNDGQVVTTYWKFTNHNTKYYKLVLLYVIPRDFLMLKMRIGFTLSSMFFIFLRKFFAYFADIKCALYEVI